MKEILVHLFKTFDLNEPMGMTLWPSYTYLFEGSIGYREKKEEDTAESESLYYTIGKDQVKSESRKNKTITRNPEKTWLSDFTYLHIVLMNKDWNCCCYYYVHENKEYNALHYYVYIFIPACLHQLDNIYLCMKV